MHGRVDVAINPDFRDLFSAFTGREVRFLVVGAYAVTFHARPRFTKDLDVWIDPESANAQRAWDALAAFGAPMREIQPKDLSTIGMVVQLGVPPNRIDVLTRIEGVKFDEAWAARAKSEYGGIAIQVLSRQHLIRNKRLLGRPQDLLDVAALEGEAENPSGG
jgi:hypothetical protein